MSSLPNSTTRFSDRADDYVKYRPGYPPGVLDYCRREMGLTPQWNIADLGSGTGIFSRVLLENGNAVFGVEPNDAMRQAAEDFLREFPRFTSVGGPAEATTLPAASVDLITAATAFHWFDPASTRAEALRILRPGGWALVLWNIRATGESPMLAEYAALLNQHAAEYRESKPEGRADPAKLTAFFGTDQYRTHSVPNFQVLDLDGLKGRMMSSSYSPKPGHPQHAPLMAGVAALFERYQQGGRVRIEYQTMLYAARMRQPS